MPCSVPSRCAVSFCVSAPPSNAVITARPKALPRQSDGSQRENTRDKPGKTPASPAPNRNRTTSSDTKPPVNPVIAVSSDHHTTTRVSIRRGPNRSASQPAGISSIAYANVKALKTKPICASLKWRSLCMNGAVIEMQTRSRYEMAVTTSTSSSTP